MSKSISLQSAGDGRLVWWGILREVGPSARLPGEAGGLFSGPCHRTPLSLVLGAPVGAAGPGLSGCCWVSSLDLLSHAGVGGPAASAALPLAGVLVWG